MAPLQCWQTAVTLPQGQRVLILCQQRCTTITMVVPYRKPQVAMASCMDRPGLLLPKDLGIHKDTGDTLAHQLAEVEAEGYHTEYLFFLRHIIFIWKDFLHLPEQREVSRLDLASRGHSAHPPLAIVSLRQRSVMPDSLRHRGLQPTRLLCPWDFPVQEYWSGLTISSSKGSSQPRD